jgi:hypothetical protein
MTTILEYLAKLLPPGLRPFAKAVIPALGTVIAVGIQYLSTGEFDRAEMTTAITGLSTALVAYLATNHTPAHDEPDDIPATSGLEAFAGNLIALEDPDVSGLVDADEDEPVSVAASNGRAEAVLTNGPRT